MLAVGGPRMAHQAKIRVASSVTRAATLTSARQIVSSCASRQNEALGARPRRVCRSQ
jgi:hypothetical protein